MRTLLALDLATKCGWALGAGKAKPRHGTAEFVNKKWDGAGVRFIKYEAWLRSMLTDHEVDLVVFEGVRAHLASAVDAAHLYGGWLTLTQKICEEMAVPYTAFGVTEIKKFWTGKGNAKKEDMIAEARKRGLDPEDDNAADALAIYFMAKAKYG